MGSGGEDDQDDKGNKSDLEEEDQLWDNKADEEQEENPWDNEVEKEHVKLRDNKVEEKLWDNLEEERVEAKKESETLITVTMTLEMYRLYQQFRKLQELDAERNQTKACVFLLY